MIAEHLNPVTIVKSQRTLAYYSSILIVSTIMYTNSIVCAVSEKKFCSIAVNIIQKDVSHTLAKACTSPGFSSYSKTKWSSMHTHTNDNIVISLLQDCKLSRFYCESHNFSASLMVSQPHKLISQVVHFIV